MRKYRCILLFVTAVILNPAYAGYDEDYKQTQLAKVFSDLHGMSVAPHEIDCHFVAPLLNEKFEPLTVYSCFPVVPVKDHPAPVSQHFQSDAHLIEFNDETGVAKPKTVKIENFAYVAFGYISEPMENDAYKPSLSEALIAPIKDSKLAAKIAQFLYMKNRSPGTSTFQLFAKRVENNQGNNLPWLNWELKNVSEVQTSDTNTEIDIPLVALLDSEGRIITGHFPTGDLTLPEEAPATRSWKIKTKAQALWAAKFVSDKKLVESPSNLVKIADLKKGSDSLADIQWRLKPGGKDWEDIRELPQQLPLTAIKSTTIGKVNGWGTNPNHKYWVWLAHPESGVMLRLAFQNNIENLKNRPIPFGNITPRKLFESGAAQREEMVDVQFGIGTVTGMENQDFAMLQSTPRGTLLIRDFHVGPDGSLDSLKAQLEFELPEWNTVHPKGHAVVNINAQLSDVKFSSCEEVWSHSPDDSQRL